MQFIIMCPLRTYMYVYENFLYLSTNLQLCFAFKTFIQIKFRLLNKFYEQLALISSYMLVVKYALKPNITKIQLTMKSGSQHRKIQVLYNIHCFFEKIFFKHKFLKFSLGLLCLKKTIVLKVN